MQFRAQGLLDLGRLDAARAHLKRAHAYDDSGAQGRKPSLAALDRQFLVAEGGADAALAVFQAARRARKLSPAPMHLLRPRRLRTRRAVTSAPLTLDRVDPKKSLAPMSIAPPVLRSMR